jgi:hypothetical protein
VEYLGDNNMPNYHSNSKRRESHRKMKTDRLAGGVERAVILGTGIERGQRDHMGREWGNKYLALTVTQSSFDQ